MCQPAPGIRCPNSNTQRAKDLSAVNKRIRRASSNIEQDGISDENKKKLEDKLKDDYNQKEGLLRNPEKTRKDATTKTPGQIESEHLREEKAQEEADHKDGKEHAEEALKGGADPEALKAGASDRGDKWDAGYNEAIDTAVAKKNAVSTDASDSPEEEEEFDAKGFSLKTKLHRSGSGNDPETGFFSDGYDANLFNEAGINQVTGTKYNAYGLDYTGRDEKGVLDRDFTILRPEKKKVDTRTPWEEGPGIHNSLDI